MNRSTLYIIAGGFFFALVAALIVQLALGGKSEPAQEAAVKAEVLVAARDLETGHALEEGDLSWTTWPQDSLFAGAVVREGQQKPGEALQGRLTRAMVKGEPVTRAALVDDTKSNFVAAALPAGKRAVAVEVSAGTSVGGFVTPGDMVDVILTYDVRLPDDQQLRDSAAGIVTKSAAEIVLENLKVLAIDQDTAKQAEAKLVRTVTLEVDPAQAETLALAKNMGELSLALRGIGDKTTVSSLEGGKAKATTDLRASRVMRELLSGQQNNTGTPSRIVRIYSGSSIQNVEVRPYTATSLR